MCKSDDRPSIPGCLFRRQDGTPWDAVVRQWPEASFLQSFAWGRQKQHFGWVAARLVVAEPRTRPLSAQVLFRRIPYSPFTLGYVPRGPLLDYTNAQAVRRMDHALTRLARRYRAVAITWEPPVADSPQVVTQLTRQGLRPAQGIQARTTRVIDLTQGLDAVAAQQHPKWRYNTRLARRHGVTIRAATDLGDLARWYALLRTTGTRDHFAVHSEEYYQRFWLDTAPSGATALLLAEHGGKLLAGILLHQFAGTVTYLYGASASEARQLMPNHLLQWEGMRWAVERGAACYDLFGIAESENPEESLAGVTRFKAGWGGTIIRYAGGFDRVYRPVLYSAVQRLRGRTAE